MKVLIAIDGSPLSFDAIRQARLILSPERDEVVLWYSPPASDVRYSPLSPLSKVGHHWPMRF